MEALIDPAEPTCCAPRLSCSDPVFLAGPCIAQMKEQDSILWRPPCPIAEMF